MFFKIGALKNFSSFTWKHLCCTVFLIKLQAFRAATLLKTDSNKCAFREICKKAPPTSFSPVTSTNIGFGPQNFLAFSFNTFATLVQNLKFVPSASPKLLNLNQDHPSKKQFFWSNPYKIEVMITFLIEMLQLPNFGHMTTSII